jgi:hypothetical protein
MANSFGTDVLIQALDPRQSAYFYVANLGFKITDETLQKVNACFLHEARLRPLKAPIQFSAK